MRTQHFFLGSGSTEKKNIDLINHHFKLEFVDSGLYFVEDENNFINPLLQEVWIRIRRAKNQRIRPDPDPC